MKLSGLSVRRGVTFSMIYLVIIGFGLFSLKRLALDLFPDISFPTVVVLTQYSGASPEDIETLVSRPIESGVTSVKGVKELRSTSKQGVSFVEVRFEWGADMDQAETEVRRALELVGPMLPDDVDDSLVFAFDPSLQPILITMISGPYPQDELRRIAVEEIEPRIARLPGIAAAESSGGLVREIRVELDPVRIAAHGLDANRVVQAVYAENSQVPGGAVEQGTLDFTVKITGKYQRVDEIGEVVVGSQLGAQGPLPVRLKDVALVIDTFREDQRMLEVDGEPAVWMMVRKQSGSNTVRAAEGVVAALPEIKRQAAADIEFKTIFNQADFINQSLGNLSTTGLAGVGITFLVLLLFLRHMRSALIVAAAVPISVIATFAVMDQAGMTLNVLSMAGLALAIGMLVDNSIVVLENIYRLREQGKDGWTAAIEGAQTVSTAVSASTLTTISVFVPVLFVPGIAGVLFRDMAVTICFSLAVSLLVALSFIPLAASRLLAGSRAERAIKGLRQKQGVFRQLQRWYRGRLEWVMAGHRWVVMAGLLAVLGVTALLAVALPMDFMAQNDESMIVVQAETAVGNNVHEAKRIMDEVVAHLELAIRPEERRMIATDTGIGEGFVAIFAKGVHAGMIRVPLVGVGDRSRSQAEIEAAVREELRKVPGVNATVGMPNMMGSDGDIDIQILGHDLDVSRTVGLELKEKLLALPDIAEVAFSIEDQKPEVEVRFDRKKLAELGLSSAAVANTINTYFMGRVAGRFADGGDEYDIRVRYGREHRLDLDELRKMPVTTLGGGTVPLGNLASIELGLGPVDITRIDQGRFTQLVTKLHARYVDETGKTQAKDLRRSIARVNALLEQYPWPQEFTFHVGGSAEDFLTSFSYLGLAFLVSVLLVYVVMAGQFESFRQPFIILFSVPLAGLGVVGIFTLTRSTMDMSALIGVIMLVGIVVNNGIVMVDAANQRRADGLERTEAIVDAAAMRLRPVLMTSLTTMLAMTPLALGLGEGSEGWAGLAKSVIGGLFAATFLTIFVVPVAYTFFARKVLPTRPLPLRAEPAAAGE